MLRTISIIAHMLLVIYFYQLQSSGNSIFGSDQVHHRGSYSGGSGGHGTFHK